MKKYLVLLPFTFLAVLVIAACSLLVCLAPPRGEGLAVRAEGSISFEDTVMAMVLGEDVERPGSYVVPYDCTYGELFALAGAHSDAYDLQERISFSDAVFVSGRLIFYIVV